MASILLVGEEELLLESRAAVLRTTGAEIQCCRPESALALQSIRPSDVIILCHSLPREFCAAITEATHTRWPNSRILQLVPARALELAEPDDDGSAVCSVEPMRLVDRTVELLGRRPPTSTRPPHRADALRSNSL